MKCPNCHNDVADSSLICPICFTKVHDGSPSTLDSPSVQPSEPSKPVVVKQVVVKTVKTNNDEVVMHEDHKEVIQNKPEEFKIIRKKTDYFFLGVILMGVVVLVILMIWLFDKNKGKPITNTTTTTTSLITGPVSGNVGYRSNFNYPLAVGQITVANIYDEYAKVDSIVDVTGLRFIEGDEAIELATLYSSDNLNEGFEWLGFEYKVTFNDLSYLGDRTISPVLDAKIYKWNGCDFINYNGKNYILNVISIYDGGNIKNNENATVKVLYQLPVGQSEYSICFGDYNKTMGCFSK